MTITDAICARLLADPDVASLVGARVYQLKMPQQPTLPAVRVQLIDEPSTYHLRGATLAWQALVQADAFANEFDAINPDPYGTAAALADAIDASLSGQAFMTTPIAVQTSFRDRRFPLYDPDELRLVRILQEYRVVYRKT